MAKKIEEMTERDLAQLDETEYYEVLNQATQKVEDEDSKVVALWAAKQVYEAVKEYSAMKKAEREADAAEARAREMEERVKQRRAQVRGTHA